MSKKICRECGDQLCKVEVYDIKAKVDMGHIWVCDDCDRRYVGWDEPGEYNGKPGGLIAGEEIPAFLPGEMEARQ